MSGRVLLPTIKYITSVGGVWGSEARYQKYCDRFKDDLDYFGEGKGQY